MIWVCIASGPSLTPEDCELVRRAGLRTIVTNNTWEMCPWADVLYAMDRRWWNHYGARGFEGRRIAGVKVKGAECLDIKTYGNSGAGAVMVAQHLGAQRIILLGYDCQRTDGRTHWHGDHPKPLGNVSRMDQWQRDFLRVKRDVTATVINCTRSTALDVFPRQSLEHAIDEALHRRAGAAIRGEACEYRPVA